MYFRRNVGGIVIQIPGCVFTKVLIRDSSYGDCNALMRSAGHVRVQVERVMMVERLIFFDIDGTLVPDTSTGSFIAKRLGSLEQMAAAERAYEEGRIDNGEVCAIDAASWCGYLRAEVESWLDELPLIAGIRETVDACRGAGIEPHLASLAWTVVGEYLCRRFGFTGAAARCSKRKMASLPAG